MIKTWLQGTIDSEKPDGSGAEFVLVFLHMPLNKTGKR